LYLDHRIPANGAADEPERSLIENASTFTGSASKGSNDLQLCAMDSIDRKLE
jgi:hypothetical protein